MDYSNVTDVVQRMRTAEGDQRDQRRQTKEAIDFCTKRNGQWETSIIQKFRGRPKYTDDRVNPIVNQIVGEVMQAEFSMRVRPAGGDATKDKAQVIDGLIRTIRNLSRFERIKNGAGRRVAMGGIAGWEIVKDYAQQMSFDQDLMIKPLHDFHQRVILDPDSQDQIFADGKWAVIKHYISKDEFERQFPEKTPVSLGHDDWHDTYYYKPEFMTIGQFYYLEKEFKTIVLMNNGAVYDQNEDFDAVIDELAMSGIEIVDTRDVEVMMCKQRWFSANEWLTDEEDIDFDFIPIVPCYGNFEITEGKIIWMGAVERLMDIQRVHNYAFSRNVEEVALSPRSKWFMTPEQVAGFENSIKSLNTNFDPVQLYNHVGDQQPPFYSNTSSANESVSVLIQMTDEGINKAAGIFAANIGDNPGMQSGVAIGKQIDRGNNGTAWVFEALEVAIERTCELLLRAIPKVYDGTREVMLTQDDGSLESMTINQPMLDEETQDTIYLYDLTQGQYDVTIDVGAAYKNRQEESIASFERVAAIYPQLLDIAADIHLGNIEAPNFDKVAERARVQMIANGMIPQEQMTDDELAAYQAQQEAMANQPPPPDLDVMAMEIEQMKAQTALLDQQNRQIDAQLKQAEIQLKMQADTAELQYKKEGNEIKIAELQMKLEMEQQKAQIKLMEQSGKLDIEQQKVSNKLQVDLSSLALKLTELEQKISAQTGSAVQLDAEMSSNMAVLTFNPETGELE